MAGTRFNARGIDESGNCANFVETELILEYPALSLVYSHVQVRGSLPLFWSQKLRSQKIKVYSLNQTLTDTAFEAHMRDLSSQYNSIVMLNLLSARGKP